MTLSPKKHGLHKQTISPTSNTIIRTMYWIIVLTINNEPEIQYIMNNRLISSYHIEIK